MTDTARIEAMRAANWTPAVEYWRNAANAAEMEVQTLRAQLAYANEAHAAETARADRAEAALRQAPQFIETVYGDEPPLIGTISEEYREVFRIAAAEVDGRK